jgi:hypothetical protein
MCVWDGTYTAPEEEREAMDQIPGWTDDFASLPVRGRRARPQRPWPQPCSPNQGIALTPCPERGSSGVQAHSRHGWQLGPLLDPIPYQPSAGDHWMHPGSQEAAMKAQTRVVESVEMPSRLQLAILEWQRQLVRARELRSAERTRDQRAYPPFEIPAA